MKIMTRAEIAVYRAQYRQYLRYAEEVNAERTNDDTRVWADAYAREQARQAYIDYIHGEE